MRRIKVPEFIPYLLLITHIPLLTLFPFSTALKARTDLGA